MNFKNEGFIAEIKRIISFSIIGVVNSGLTYVVDQLLYYGFDVNKNISFSIGYFLGMLNSYVLNSYFTFKSKSSIKKSGDKFIKFFVVNIASYLAALGAKNLFAYLFGTEGLNWLNSGFAIFAAQVVNYLGYKIWVFAEKK